MSVFSDCGLYCKHPWKDSPEPKLSVHKTHRNTETCEKLSPTSCLLLLSLLNCENSFYSLYETFNRCVCKYCSQSVTCLSVYFKGHKVLILMKSILSVFAIKVFPFCVLCKKSFTNPVLQRFSKENL